MRFIVLLAATASLFLAGCSSVDSPSLSRSVREKFEGPTFQTHVVHADQHAAYAAAKAALQPMAFNFVAGGPNQGKLTGLTDIVPGNDVRPATQISLEVRISQVEEGTEIGAVFTDLIEDTFDQHPGLARSKQIDSPGIYENYFHHIDLALAAAASESKPVK